MQLKLMPWHDVCLFFSGLLKESALVKVPTSVFFPPVRSFYSFFPSCCTRRLSKLNTLLESAPSTNLPVQPANPATFSQWRTRGRGRLSGELLHHLTRPLVLAQYLLFMLGRGKRSGWKRKKTNPFLPGASRLFLTRVDIYRRFAETGKSLREDASLQSHRQLKAGTNKTKPRQQISMKIEKSSWSITRS